ncbi:MAG TPA: ferritin-like domain-containing protein, partial [Burkholderiaceae bacterium]|nr:ferritin-like domain-containing protein [Burkholderiaceae bacterium]
MSATPHPPSREQLIYWLHEAAEIEHHLMCCYLYAAFSLKRSDPRWTDTQREAVERWRRTLMSVVFEEMTHLALVGNLAQALGASPHMNRPTFPVDAGPYPAGFVIRLQPFSADTIAHFRFLERPSHEPAGPPQGRIPQGAARRYPSERLADAAGFVPQRAYRRAVPEGRLSPGPRDYDTVGELYEVLAQSLDACAAAFGEAALFVGDPALQVDAMLVPLPGMLAVTDLASAQQAIHTIVTQGEGAGSEQIDSHFCRFTHVGEELAALTAADPSFEPAWPAATNPVMNAPIHSASQRVHINEPRIARWLDIANAMYTTSLRCLLQGFGARERPVKATWLAASFALMRALVPVGQGLAARPASTVPDGPHAGLTFTPLRTLALLPHDGAAAFAAERLGQLRQRAIELPLQLVAGESTATWPGVID